MNIHIIVFLVAVVVFLGLMAAAAVSHVIKIRRVSRSDLERLMSKFVVVNREDIKRIALDIIDESGQRREDSEAMSLGSRRIWQLIGGIEGLEVLEGNCAVLIELAYYLHKWYPDAVTVADDLRQKSRQIEWHIDRLKHAATAEKAESDFADYAQPAIALYYLMTKKVLALYSINNLPLTSNLEHTL